jgi:hypothetical protein
MPLNLCHMRTNHWVSYESLSGPWTVCLSLIGRCAIAQTKSCTVLLGLYVGYGMHYSSDKHHVCNDGMNLDCGKVTVITSD